MPGSANNYWLRQIFNTTPMPATMEQSEQNCGGGAATLARRTVHTRLNKGVIQDGDRYWLSDDVLAEGIAGAQKEIVEWQAYIDYWQQQQRGLALRFPDSENQRTIFLDPSKQKLLWRLLFYVKG